MTQKKYLILDFDECIFEHPAELEANFSRAYGEVAVQTGAPLTVEEATQKAYDYYMQTGMSNQVFDGYGRDMWEVFEELHVYLYNTYVTRFADEIRARNIRPYFDCPEFECVILTHGTTYWARTNLELLGIKDLFSEDRILGLEKVNYQLKCSTQYPYEKALKALGLSLEDIDKEEIYFVDDSARNHRVPNEMGIKTVQVGPKTKKSGDLDFIQYRAESLWSFLEQLKDQKQSSQCA